MNKAILRILSLGLLVCLVVGCFAGCQPADGENNPVGGPATVVDYISQLKLDKDSESKKVEVTVKTFIDGDTTHFNMPEGSFASSVLKARYLAVNTPESTGKIEEYGKKASNFTKEKLSGAESIIIESDDGNWNADSTGDRYLVWVWYKPKGESEYRNLNLEILQNGLAIASNSAQNRYGDLCMKALNQARDQKLNVFSGQKDPDFYYGEAVELDLKELRTNTEAYNNMKVAFNGVVTMNNDATVYVESYDEETGLYYGISVYYGFNLSGKGMEILSVGNEVRIVGSVQYYEAGGTWQVADLTYRQMKPNDPGNIQKISDGKTGAFTVTDPKTFVNGKVTIQSDDGKKEFPYAQLALSTTVEMKNLKVVKTYTTTNEDSSSKGAMTLTCEVDGVTVDVRTVVFYDAQGNLITADAYAGKTIDVKGIVDYFGGSYQIKVLTPYHITIH